MPASAGLLIDIDIGTDYLRGEPPVPPCFGGHRHIESLLRDPGRLSGDVRDGAVVVRHWAYSPLMPVLPGLGVGVLPSLQWMLVSTAAFYYARQLWRAARRVVLLKARATL